MTVHMTYEEGYQKYIKPLFTNYKGSDPGFYRCLIYILFANHYRIIDVSSTIRRDPSIFDTFINPRLNAGLPFDENITSSISSFMVNYWGKSPACMSLFSSLMISVTEIDKTWFDTNYTQLIDSLINQMVSRSGKGYSEFFQPEEVTNLIVALSDYSGCGNVYNPYAGTGSYGIALNLQNNYVAQEFEIDTWILGVIRLLAHGISTNRYTLSNSVYEWAAYTSYHSSQTRLRTPNEKFELIVATPPFKARAWGKFEDRDAALPYRYLEEDFINRGLDGIQSNGTLIGLFAPYVLYMNGKTEALRRRYIDSDLLDTVVLLPGNLFSTSSIQTVILKFKANKENPGRVRFVDGTSFYRDNTSRKSSEKKRTLEWQELLSVIRGSLSSEFVTLVSNEEIINNDYSLDIQSYFGKESGNNIPEGYTAFRIRELAELIPGDRVVSSEQKGRIVSISELSKEPFKWELNLASLEEDELDGAYRKIECPAVVVGRFKESMYPSIVLASKEEPVYISSSVFAFHVNESLIERSFFCYLLSNGLDRIQFGTVAPTLSSKALLDTQLFVAPLEMQHKILAAAEEEYLKNLVSKHGLEKYIEQQQEEFRKKLSGRKHDLRNSFLAIKADFKAIKGFVESKDLSGAILNPNTGVTLGGKLNAILHNFDKVTYFINELDRKETFGYPESMDLIERLTTFSNQSSLVYRSSFKWDIPSINELSGESDESAALVNINSGDFDRVLNNILQNAISHGFTDSTRTDYVFDIILDYDKGADSFVISFKNNGNPLPRGIDKERYGKQNEKGDDSHGEGKGGYIVKSVIEHFGGSYDVLDEEESDSGYTVTIIVKLPRYVEE